MKVELKKFIVFGVIISFFTSTYAAFLSTIMKRKVFSTDFFLQWMSAIPGTYLLLLPFVLVTGPLTRLLVERLFRR